MTRRDDDTTPQESPRGCDHHCGNHPLESCAVVRLVVSAVTGSVSAVPARLNRCVRRRRVAAVAAGLDQRERGPTGVRVWALGRTAAAVDLVDLLRSRRVSPRVAVAALELQTDGHPIDSSAYAGTS